MVRQRRFLLWSVLPFSALRHLPHFCAPLSPSPPLRPPLQPRYEVLNHERFAREVLGRWFKHQKFASFVRQLNMYGFHKIPHLQQGVLKSDSDTEPWHFEHPNFRRGQPDLLCLIQRKKQPNHGQADEPMLDVNDATTAAPPATVQSGHLLDINSIVNGVSAIKRHQQAISSDLSALKQSNDALWKEAIAARQRHAKHQDTINRILKFLAGVFGHAENTPHSADGSHTPPQVTPRIRQRLMIGNGRVPKHVDIVEVEDDEADYRRNKGNTPFSGEHPLLGFLVERPSNRRSPPDRFASVTTPNTSASTPSIVETIPPSEAYSPAADSLSDQAKSPPLRPSQIISRTNSASPAPRLIGAAAPNPISNPPTLPPMNGQNAPDAVMWQAALQQMMSNPAQFQRIMQAFANQQPPIPNLTTPSEPPPPSNLSHSAVAAYDPTQTDYARWFNSTPSSSTTAQQPLLAPVPTDESPPIQLLLDESNRLQKSYRDATEIDADMDMLQSSINSLIQNLGIDPSTLASSSDDSISPISPVGPNPNGTNGIPHTNGFPPPLPPDPFANGANGVGPMGGLDLHGSEAVPDYLLDSLLSQIGDGRVGGGGLDYPDMDITDRYDHNARIDGTAIEDASTEQLAAFLDEASVSADGGSPKVTRSPRVATNGTTVHAKRKSDVADLPLPTPPAEETGRKVKRKR